MEILSNKVNPTRPLQSVFYKCSQRSGSTDRSYRSHLFRSSNVCERCGISKDSLKQMKIRIKSGRVDDDGRMHFALMKNVDQDSKSGRLIDAMSAAKLLLKHGIWPLWEKSPGRVVVSANDRVCVYLCGMSAVVASARIQTIVPWSREIGETYPLILGGTPSVALCLDEVIVSDAPIFVADHIEQLNCIGRNKKKWGAAFCGGMRSLTKHDFSILTKFRGD